MIDDYCLFLIIFCLLIKVFRFFFRFLDFLSRVAADISFFIRVQLKRSRVHLCHNSETYTVVFNINVGVNAIQRFYSPWKACRSVLCKTVSFFFNLTGARSGF